MKIGKSREDITLLQNASLVEEISSIRHQLWMMGEGGPLARVARIAEQEYFNGRPEDRRRFVKRAARAILKRIFNLDVFLNLPPPPNHRPAPWAAMPGRYARLVGELDEWRRGAVAETIAIAPGEHASERRRRAHETWSEFVASRPDLPFLQTLEPHKGRPGKLRILILLGGGGLGDALLFSAVAAALHTKFGPCDIVFMYEKTVLESLYKNNPTVACAVAAPWHQMDGVAKASRWLGIFDLFIDIYCFLPRYLVCESARLTQRDYSSIVQGNIALGEVADAFSSNLGISLLDRAYNVHVLDLLAGFTGLSLNAATPLVFSPDPEGIRNVQSLKLPDRYVTMRDGSNPGDMAEARRLGSERATKQLPLQKWSEVIALLRSLGLSIVQVGDTGDPIFAEADIDLRGKTTLSQLCFVMKGAVAHVDTEGGLAHFARAANVRSIVFFGVTSKTFFGYPANLNLESEICNRCWYSNKTWIGECPRQTEGPVCGTSIDIEPMRSFLIDRIAEKFEDAPRVIDSITMPDDTKDRDLWLQSVARKCSDRVLKTDRPFRGCFINFSSDLRKGLAEVRPFDAGGLRNEIIASGSVYNMPINSETFDIVVMASPLDLMEFPRAAVDDALRLVTRDGVLIITTGSPSAAPQSETVTDYDLASIFQYLSMKQSSLGARDGAVSRGLYAHCVTIERRAFEAQLPSLMKADL